MKIAYIYDCIYPYIKGGAEKRIWEIAKRLARRGHEVHIYGIKWWSGEDIIEREGVFLHGVCPPAELYTDGRRSIRSPIYFAARVWLPLMRDDFDIVDCQQFPYFPCISSKVYSILKGVPLAITWYEVWDRYWLEYLGKPGVFGWAIERIVLRMPDMIIPISEKIKEDLKQIGGHDEIMRVAPNGVDFAKMDGMRADGTKSFDIIYVGRLISHKNVNILLDAIYLLKKDRPQIRCAIIGDGPERENLLKLCKARNLAENVVFLGFVEKDEDVYRYMHSSRLFVLPSTREGFPNTILEANSCGLPAIIVDGEKNAATGVVRSGYNGYILNLSPEEIAEKIGIILRDEELMQSLQNNSRIYAGEHDWDIIVKNLEGIYGDMMR